MCIRDRHACLVGTVVQNRSRKGIMVSSGKEKKVVQMTENRALEIAWYGHAMFTISGGGITVACDPVPPEVGYTYDPAEADAVLISHEHFDHCYLAGIKGSPTVIRKAGSSRLDGIEVTGIATFHDAKGGAERGPNIIFTWEPVSYTHLRAHETRHDLVCRLL